MVGWRKISELDPGFVECAKCKTKAASVVLAARYLLPSGSSNGCGLKLRHNPECKVRVVVHCGKPR
jgi:hypothetical protein